MNRITLSLVAALGALGISTPASAVVIDFSGGTATLSNGGTVPTSDTSLNAGVVSYVEDGVLVEFIGLTADWGSYIGDYYAGGNSVIHTHWDTLQAVRFSMLDGSAFDLNYMDIASNTELGGGPASGLERSWITASNGATVLMASSDWGWSDGAERMWFGPEFDGITSFTVTSDNAYCFGLDNFFINEPPPPPVDPDTDLDGVVDSVDNCLLAPNADQADFDGDGFGDVCDVCAVDPDNDADADGFCANEDNCPWTANPGQADFDGDGLGNECDSDDDNDGIGDASDNCQFDVNPDQADFDGDGAGDVCDADSDMDGVVDAGDECLMTTPGDAVDATGCSVAQLCPCDNNWKNHGGYVKCVAHTSEAFVLEGLITLEEKDLLVSTAAQSTCGAKK